MTPDQLTTRSARQCEHVFVPGTPFSRDHLLGIFDRAIAEPDADYALRTARNIEPPTGLDRALRLTIALAKRPHPHFNAAARRFVARFADEAEGTTLRGVAQAADALAVLSVVSDATDREKQEAERDMLRLAHQLEQQR
jgi:hypothetical protein